MPVSDPDWYFTFELGPAAQELQVIARVAGIVFSAFHAELSSGDALIGEPEMLEEARPYPRLASEAPVLPSSTLAEAVAMLVQFWNPALADSVKGLGWSPGERSWLTAPNADSR
ncbi:MAG: hypothetical protein ACR2PL_05655 [Dehalococcoidia bacterium]